MTALQSTDFQSRSAGDLWWLPDGELIVCEACDHDKARLTLTAWAARLRALVAA